MESNADSLVFALSVAGANTNAEANNGVPCPVTPVPKTSDEEARHSQKKPAVWNHLSPKGALKGVIDLDVKEYGDFEDWKASDEYRRALTSLQPHMIACQIHSVCVALFRQLWAPK